MLSSLFQKIAPTIAVQVSPERFEFRRGDRLVVLKPVLYLGTATPHSTRILGVSEPPANQESRPVAVFVSVGGRQDPIASQEELLESFLSFGIKGMFGPLFMRPRVEVSGAASLRDRVIGDPQAILAQALTKAGAATVTFL